MSDVITIPSNEVKEAVLKTYIANYVIDSELQNGDRNRRYFIRIVASPTRHTHAYGNPVFAILEAYKMVRNMMIDMAGIVEREDK